MAKFNAAGVRQFSTYLGGSDVDHGYGIALDGSGNAFVTGYTYSGNFPTTAGVLQTSSHGGGDAFVTKMASNGSSLVYSTYLGGSSTDHARAIAVHSSGSAYVTGYTYSSDFPTTPGAVQTALLGYVGGFVAKLNASGTALSFGTYLGGGKLDYAQDIAVDEPAGNLYVTGYTYSGDFPTANALQVLKPNPGTVLYRTGDGGGSWSLADSGLSATNVSALSIDPGTPSTVVAGTNYGIFRTTDSGSNWSLAWGSSASALARSPSNPGILYAAHNNSIYQSTDGGTSWVYRGEISGYGVQGLAVHPAISGTLYAGTSNGGVYRSVDSGATWTPVNAGLGNLYVRFLVIDPTAANVLYAGTGSSVYKSTDGAATWNATSTGMSGGNVYAMAMDPSNSSVLYAVVNGCVYKTTNAAANWNNMACPGSGSTSLVMAPSNPAVLYAGTYSGMWRSADAGVTWNPANSGIADTYIYSVAVHPTNPSLVYAGTSSTSDAFVTKLNPAGTAYVYSTYLGGPQGYGLGYGIAADSSGNAYVTGYTSSYSFPTTAGAFQRSSRTAQAFVSKISDATASCSYAVNPASQFFYSGGGTANFSVVSPTGCAWTATPGAGWIGVTNGSSGTGVAAVSISVGSNSGAARSTTLVVGGQTIAVTQGASGCSYSLSTGNISVPGGGGSYDVTLTAGAGCDWVVQNAYSWITVTPSSSGTGGGQFTVSVTANPNFNSRNGFIYIGGQYLYLTQSGTSVNSLSSSSAAVDWTGGARSVDVTCSSPVCTWSAWSNASWLSITGYSGTGSGAVNYTVAANRTGAARSGTLTISGQTFTVTQSPQLNFVPITPCRVADTRNPAGPFGGPFIAGNTSRDFSIFAGSCGIPSNALAYSFNVTVAPTGGLLYLSMWPTGQPRPIVSTLNALDGRWTANAAIVPAGTNGSISVFVSDPTHVILDINGYFVPAATVGSLAFYPLTPCRVMDTRGGTSIGAGGTRTVPVRSSACSVPSGAVAYALNFTALPHGPLGWITTWPTGSPKPTASTLNAPTGTITANAAILPAGTDGSVDVYASNATDLLVDINGYFAPPGAGGLSFATLTPCRVADTRNPNGPFGGPPLQGARDFAVAASACAVPAGAQAYSLNATVWPATGFLNWLTLWPAGGAMPRVSTLNSYDGRLVANAALVPTTNGAIGAYSSDLTTFLLDINGYFAP